MKVCPKCGKQFADDANFCPVDAAKLQSASQLVPVITGDSALEARFDRGDRLGGGPSGEVFRATDKQTGAPVAVKLVAPPVLAIPQVAQRLERELKQLERVEHPAIAKVIASGRQGGQVWVATELVPGARTLADVVASSGPLDPQRASDVVLVIGEALIEAAKVGVVHRDLAPKNVLVAGDEVKLINFCVPVPTSDRIPGVPEFVAPDLIEGKPVDQRSNIYSLGALYYFLLTGQPPFTGDAAAVHQAHVTQTPVPPSQRAPVPADLDGVVARAMEHNAAKRYLTVRQFLDDIGRLAQTEGAAAGGADDSPASTAPFGRAGKQAALAQTMLGVGPSAANEAKTRRIDVQVPPEAVRDGAVAGTIEVSPHAYAQSPAPEAPAPQAASPWAPQVAPAQAPVYAQPPAAAYAPQVQAGGLAAPQAASPVLAAPASPTLPPAGASGKKKPEGSKPAGTKGKFRETMWFKKGDLDAAAAEVAAEERAQGKDVDLDRADNLPMEERYSDDGTISRTDAERYSLKTGSTQMMPAIRGGDMASASGKVSEDELIADMKSGRTKMIVAIAAAVLVIVVILIFVL